MFFHLLWLFLIHGVFSAVTRDNNDYYKLNIVHYNDFHARYEETSVTEAVCRSNTTCLGGFPRLYYTINQLLASDRDAVLLNAGDTFQGTFWYTLLKWNIAQEFMNLLPHDAHAIGNHEFDDGPEGLVPYLKALKAPVLAANMDTTLEPSFAGTYKPSIVIERKGRKIGIIGLITVDTQIFATTGNVKFTDPGEATKREAEALTKQGVDIIILLSHCGLEVDKQLAKQYGQYIDVIVGGHTHSLLWKEGNDAPSNEPVVGPYPVILQTAADNRHKVLIVQASAFTKYIGNLVIYFDSNGDYVKWEGGAIYMGQHLPEDPEIKKKLEPYARLVHEAENQRVGQTLVKLTSEECSSGECALGNLLTDALVEYAKEKVNSSLHYLAFVQRGNMLSKTLKKGTITKVNLFDMYPFLDRILHFEMKGEHLKKVLEASVSDAVTLDPFDGPWLQQVSGLQVTYNVSLPEGHRVTSVRITNENPETLDENKYYDILTAKFSLFFGKGFLEMKKSIRNVREIGRDHNTLEAYVVKHSPLNISTYGRIVINK